MLPCPCPSPLRLYLDTVASAVRPVGRREGAQRGKVGNIAPHGKRAAKVRGGGLGHVTGRSVAARVTLCPLLFFSRLSISSPPFLFHLTQQRVVAKVGTKAAGRNNDYPALLPPLAVLRILHANHLRRRGVSKVSRGRCSAARRGLCVHHKASRAQRTSPWALVRSFSTLALLTRRARSGSALHIFSNLSMRP